MDLIVEQAAEASGHGSPANKTSLDDNQNTILEEAAEASIQALSSSGAHCNDGSTDDYPAVTDTDALVLRVKALETALSAERRENSKLQKMLSTRTIEYNEVKANIEVNNAMLRSLHDEVAKLRDSTRRSHESLTAEVTSLKSRIHKPHENADDQIDSPKTVGIFHYQPERDGTVMKSEKTTENDVEETAGKSEMDDTNTVSSIPECRPGQNLKRPSDDTLYTPNKSSRIPYVDQLMPLFGLRHRAHNDPSSPCYRRQEGNSTQHNN